MWKCPKCGEISEVRRWEVCEYGSEFLYRANDLMLEDSVDRGKDEVGDNLFLGEPICGECGEEKVYWSEK